MNIKENVRCYLNTRTMWGERGLFSGAIDEIGVGLYDYDPETGETHGTYGEFFFRWYVLGDKGATAARLEAFGDSWRAFPQFSDLFAALSAPDVTEAAGKKTFTPEELERLLDSLGIINASNPPEVR